MGVRFLGAPLRSNPPLGTSHDMCLPAHSHAGPQQHTARCHMARGDHCWACAGQHSGHGDLLLDFTRPVGGSAFRDL